MRNLLSFVFGLVSGLLYALVRAVLALDRLICWFYDLPLWPAIGRAFHFAQRSRAVCAFSLFVPLFFVPGALLTQPGTLVLADGAPLGVVADADTAGGTGTIQPGSGTMCDAFSTALFVMGEERALDFWRSGVYDFDLILVTEDGRLLVTDGIADRFQPDETAGYAYEVIS